MIDLTLDLAKFWLEYCPITGSLSWRVSPKHRSGDIVVGQTAGYIDEKGYRRVTVAGGVYKAHRLVWFMHHGRWPQHQIDHINGNRLDNRIENLREAMSGQNRANSRRNNRIKTGLMLPKGVVKRKYTYRAQITVNKKTIYLGEYKTPEEAHAVYCQAADRFHGEYSNHGD